MKKNVIKKWIRKLFGTVDYHSHVRLRPIIKYAKKKKVYGSFLEIGCGNGIIAFELNRRGHLESYVGLDMNKDAIDEAVKVKKCLKESKITFLAEDAFKFLDSVDKNKKYDYVILYDFIEHIYSPEEFLKDLLNHLGNDKAIFLVSVPTPNYPKVFGRKFHESIGHLVDGYHKNELDALFEKINYKAEYYQYNTGLFGNIGAYIFYHAMNKVNLRILSFCTLPFRIVDINSEKISSSLFAVYLHQ